MILLPALCIDAIFCTTVREEIIALFRLYSALIKSVMKENNPKKNVQRMSDIKGRLSSAGSSPRGKQMTINDIAHLAGVSKKSVSRVINEVPTVHKDIRDKVNEVIAKTGFKPNPQARGLAFRKSFLIAMIYDNPNATFIVGMQAGILDALRGTGYELLVHQCERRSPRFIADVREFVERQQPHGVILLPPISENLHLLKMLHEVGCPHVSVAAANVEAAMHRVVSRDHDACAEAGLHLAGLGHKHIAVIAGPEGHRSVTERLSGFIGALQSQGLQVPPELIAHGAYTFESGIQAGEMLLTRQPRPTAIFSTNDEMAAGVYQAAHRLGITIPQDLSVVGFDDNPIASRLWPPLTTIRLPIPLMARLAATPLISSNTAQSQQDSALVVPNLVIRNSTQAPPNTTDYVLKN